MSNKLDAEINRSVAEIEGFIRPTGNDWIRRNPNGSTDYLDHEPPPYVTEWSWCGPLIQKYKIELRCNAGGKWSASGNGFWEEAETPMQAICLGVIAFAKRHGLPNIQRNPG